MPQPLYVAPPPRSVPQGLRFTLLANRLTLWGAAFLGPGALAALGFLLAGDPIGDLRLDRARVEVPGVLNAVETTRSGKSFVYRYLYEFQTGGARRAGASYADVRPAAPPQAVVVEVAGRGDAINRVRGTRLSAYPRSVPLIALSLFVVGVPLTARGLFRGWRQIRLLRIGELARAAITACRITGDPSGRSLPIEQFRARWHYEAARVIAEHAAAGFMGCFRLIGLIVWLVGMAALVFVIAAAVFIEGVVETGEGQFESKWEAVRYLIGVAAAWIATGLVVYALLRRKSTAERRREVEERLAALPPDMPLPGRDANLEVEMTLEFRTATGAPVQTRTVGAFNPALGDEPTEAVLYDPARPSRVALVDALSALVRGRAGAWDDIPGLAPRVKIAFVLVALATTLAVALLTAAQLVV